MCLCVLVFIRPCICLCIHSSVYILEPIRRRIEQAKKALYNTLAYTWLRVYTTQSIAEYRNTCNFWQNTKPSTEEISPLSRRRPWMTESLLTPVAHGGIEINFLPVGSVQQGATGRLLIPDERINKAPPIDGADELITTLKVGLQHLALVLAAILPVARHFRSLHVQFRRRNSGAPLPLH